MVGGGFVVLSVSWARYDARMESYRYGALTIIESAGDHNAVQRDLKQIDPRLFLEKQLTYDGQEVWCVMCEVDGEGPDRYLCVFEWRDPDTGAPIPVLSSGIVTRLQKMERDPKLLAARVKEQNEQFKAKKKAAFVDHITDFAQMQVKSWKSNNVLHRGPSLARARRAQRRMGHNV